MKEFLSQNSVEFTYVDITESIANLKAFLNYRDNRSEFSEVRQVGRVGIPFILVDDEDRIILGQPDLSDLS